MKKKKYKGTVLIADNRTETHLIEDYLKDIGYHVINAYSAEDVLIQSDAHFDIALIDRSLARGMDEESYRNIIRSHWSFVREMEFSGDEMIQILANQKPKPIIICIGVYDTDNSKKFGADASLPKPWEREDLMQLIENIRANRRGRG